MLITFESLACTVGSLDLSLLWHGLILTATVMVVCFDSIGEKLLGLRNLDTILILSVEFSFNLKISLF